MLPQKLANSLLRVLVFIGCIVKPKPNRIESNDNEHNKPRKLQKISFTKDASLHCSRYLSCHAMLCDNQLCHAMLCDISGPVRTKPEKFENSVTKKEILGNAYQTRGI